MTLTVEICTKKVQQEEEKRKKKKAQFSLTDIDRNSRPSMFLTNFGSIYIFDLGGR